MAIEAYHGQEAQQAILAQDRKAREAMEREFQQQHPDANGKPRKPEFDIIDSKTLAARECKTEYHVKGFLAKRQPCILAGPKKTLKTNIMLDLAVSLATRSPFLGNFYTDARTPTLVMSGESGDTVIQETCRRICISKGWAFEKVQDLYFSFKVPQIANVAHVKEIRDFIIDKDIKVIVIDPAYLAMGGLGDNAGNLFAVGSQLWKLTELCEETGVTPILIHHTKSSTLSYDDPPELEDIAWAGFSEWCRQWILLGRREKYEPENAGSHKLWVTAGGSAGHSQGWALDIQEGSQDDDGGRRWGVEVIKASQARHEAAQAYAERKAEVDAVKKDATRQKRRQDVIGAFKRYPEGAAKTSIRDTAGMSSTVFQPILDDLLDTNTVTEFTNDKGKTWYRLSENQPTGQPDN
jgi:AAA domain